MIAYQRFTAEDGRSIEMGLGVTGMVVERLPALAQRLDAKQGTFEAWECQQIAKILSDIAATSGDDDDENASELEHLVQFFHRSGQVTMTQINT
jgi:hypothetical protein